MLLAIVVMIGSAAAAAAYLSNLGRAPAPLILGVVHQTEIRTAPETSGRLASFQVTAGQDVRKGDILAMLSAPELTAALQDARANAAKARAERANVYAGTRKEEIDIAAQNLRIAEANLTLARQQHARSAALALREFASAQQLDERAAELRKAEASLGLMQASYDESVAGPTKEERDIADAKVALADAAAANLEAKLAKAMLVAPSDGMVGLLVAEPGEAISAGQPVMTLEPRNERWFTFTIREDRLAKIAVGSLVNLQAAGGHRIEAHVTELRPLGEFAVWRAARAVGDHDTNSFLMRADPSTPTPGMEPGMSVWIDRDRD
jgi:multidrug resistance efflux pump